MIAKKAAKREQTDVVGCPQCDWVSQRTELSKREHAECPRCGYFLEGAATRHHTLVAIAAAALVLLLASLQVNFISYSVTGSEQSMTLMDAAWQLSFFHEKVLAVLVLLTVILIPVLYLVSLIWVYSQIHNSGSNRLNRYFLRLMEHLKPWLMTDVFLLGTLVSLVKI